MHPVSRLFVVLFVLEADKTFIWAAPELMPTKSTAFLHQATGKQRKLHGVGGDWGKN